MQREYGPAVAPLSLMDRVIDDMDKNTELMLETILVPVHEDGVKINARVSAVTFTSPEPLSSTDCDTPLLTGITFGTAEVKPTILNGPASKYGDDTVQRAHIR